MGSDIVFLISQPRAGSTMTQMVLSQHPMIYSRSESWVLLHPMHALKPDNLVATYDVEWSMPPVIDFINSLPGGLIQYQKAIAEAYSGLYHSLLLRHNKKIFLDKTPRYYLIIEELHAYFPEARFIFLFRNPAAVIASMASTWAEKDWFLFSNYREDLLQANKLMIEGLDVVGEKGYRIQYEELIADPDTELRSMCHFLSIPFEEEMKDYGKSDEKWLYGDQETVYAQTKPVSDFVNIWTERVKHPQIWRIVYDYIHFLGREMVQTMGYSFDELHSLLELNKPDVNIERNSYPLFVLIDKTRNTILENKQLQERFKELSSTVSFLTEEIANKNDILNVSQKKIDELKLMVESKQHELTESTNRLVEMDVLKQSLEEDVVQKQQQISEYDELIGELKERINQALSLEKIKEELLNKQNDLISTLQDDLAKANQEIKTNLNQSLALDKLNNELSATLGVREQAIEEYRLFIHQIEKSISFRLGTILVKPARKIKQLLK